jgi:hypothetical protein
MPNEKGERETSEAGSLATRPWQLRALGESAVFDSPFAHATFGTCLPDETGDAVLSWLETHAAWRLKKTDFYEQFEFDCRDSPSVVASFLTSPSILELVRAELESVFERTFQPEISVVCHKLVAGHRIGIHNDYLEGEETHRLVIQLNRGLSQNDGGFLMLFGSDDAADVRKVLRPLHLGGFAFEISKNSFHAVSAIHSGARYSLIYSLRAVRS